MESFDRRRARTAKGNELSPAKMPLMRIRSVEIVFEDEMSTCTDTGLLDRSIELMSSDSSDDSTKCVDDTEHLQERDDDSVTLNADADFSDDNSVSKDANDRLDKDQSQASARGSARPSVPDESINISEIGDSGHYTEEACSSHVEVQLTYDDALLSHSHDVLRLDETSPAMYELSELERNRLYQYVDSNSDSSDNTAVCDSQSDAKQLTSLNDVMDPEDQSLDSSDLQYDSFVDMGKF